MASMMDFKVMEPNRKAIWLPERTGAAPRGVVGTSFISLWTQRGLVPQTLNLEVNFI